MATYARNTGSTLTIQAAHVARAHTVMALAAFFTALLIGCSLHYKKIVKNGVAGYPDEWFPSVSATIGDWYPERNIFQIMIALTSGPRFALVFLQYYITRTSTRTLPFWVFVTGIVRTLACGGWVYITSTDDHDAHDVLMITYIVCNIPWMFGGIACTLPEHTKALRRRKLFTSIFFISIIPLVYFFIQHKVHRIPGAYTHYAFFEWGLIITDVLYDSVSEVDFASSDLQITIGSWGANANGGRTHTAKDSSESTPPETKQEDAEGIATVPVPSLEMATKPPTVDNKRKASTEPDSIKPPSMVPLHSFLSFLSDVYLAYVFWSIFTSLPLTLFYFSVWELGIAGHEASLLSILSPVLLFIPPFLRFSRTKGGRIVLHMLSFVGLAAYKLDSPFHRLLAVSIATMAACIGAAVDLSAPIPQVASYNAILLGIGLITSGLSKHANHGNNPVWPIVNERSGGYNKTGLILAILSILELTTRPAQKLHESKPKTSNTSQTTRTSFGSTLLSAAPLGSLIFTLLFLMSDPSTLIAWSWTGYPIQGPVPHIHGSLTLIAQSLGLIIPAFFSAFPTKRYVLTHPLWYFCGAASSFILYQHKNWLGYGGGVGFVVFVMSIIPQVVLRASHTGRVATTFFLAMFIVLLLDLASVWTVAYAFVPGGPYLRERTDLVLLAQVTLLAPAFDWPAFNLQTKSSKPNLLSGKKMYTCGLLAIFSILSVLVTLYRMPSTMPQPYRPGSRILRAGIWTVHFGIDTEGRDSQRRMRDLIRDMELDVVGLLETDLHRIVFGNRDLTRLLSEEIGYFVDIGPGPNQHTWGAVLLSKFPIINSTHHLLPSPRGELAPCIHAVLDVWGTKINVFVAHNGQEEDPLDRELQSTEIARLMSEVYPEPVIFLGYLVTKPHAPRPAPYGIMVNEGRVHDIDLADQDRWCQYIFFRGLYRTSYARVSRSTITDTELQIGQFALPRHGTFVDDSVPDDRYIRARKEELSEPHWFPMEYYGNEEWGGKNGHFYHVFGTPLYYKIPEGVPL